MKNKIVINAAETGNYGAVRRLLMKERSMQQFKSDDEKWETALLAASRNGHDNIVRLLRKYNVLDIQHSGDKKRSLIIACERGFTKVVVALLKGSSLSYEVDNDGRTALIHASRNGHDLIVRMLLKSGAYVHQQDNDGKNALMYACIAGHENIVRQVMKNKVKTNINAQDNSEKTALIHACSEGHFNIVEILLKSNAYINETDKDRRTAFFHGCSSGNRDIVRLLVQYGASLNVLDVNRKTVLIYACQNEDAEMVECLLSCGVTIRQLDCMGQTVIDYACFQNFVRAADVLIKHGVETSHTDSFGRNMSFCAREGREEILKLFIKHRVSLTAFRYRQLKLLALACTYGQLEVVKLLLTQTNERIDINERDDLGRTGFMIACERGYSDIVEYLLTNKKEVIKVTDKAADGRSALILAIEEGHDSVVSLLLKSWSNVDLTGVDNKQRTPLMYACLKGDLKTVRILTSQQMIGDSGVRDCHKKTALIYACELGHLDVVRHLLSLDVNSNSLSCMDERRRALIYACSKGHENVVELLVQRGVKVSKTRLNGLSALHIACQSRNPKMVELIMSAGCSRLKHSGHMSPLMIACDQSDEKIVQILVDQNVNVNVRCLLGGTALMYACLRDCVAVVEILLSVGANVNASNKRGDTALTVACERGNNQIISLLLAKKDIKVNGFGTKTRTPLTSVCKLGKENVVRQLLKVGVDVNEMDSGGTSPLIYACDGGHTGIVSVLLQHGALLNIRDRSNNTHPLTYAWAKGWNEIMRLLLKPGIDPNALFRDEETVLMHACRVGDTEMVRLMLDLHYDFLIPRLNSDGKFAFIYAAENGFDEIVDLMMTRFQWEGLRTDRAGRTALIWACLRGREKVVKVLLRHIDIGVINVCDENSKTALNYALENHHMDIALSLLREGIHVNCPGRDERTPLMYASWTGSAELVRKILSHGGDVNSQDRSGRTALILACGRGLIARRIVEQLLENGADVDAKDETGKTALMYSCEKGFEDAVDMLIDRGADVNESDKEDKTPLMYAFKHWMDNSKVIQRLIQSEADINARDFMGKSVLMCAIEKNKQLCSLRLLLKCGVNVNSSTKTKKTALMLACELGYKHAVGLLKRKGADVNAKNFLGRTPLMLACSKEHFDIVKMLVKYGANVQARNKKGETALMIASRGNSGRDNIVKYLIKNKGKAGINWKDRQSATALMHACKARNHDAMLELLYHDADAKIEDHRLFTPLLHACSVNDEFAAGILLDYGPDVDVKGIYENDDDALFYHAEAFEFAASMGHEQIVDMMLCEHNFCPELYSCLQERTALLAACSHGYTKVVDVLLASGAYVDGDTWKDSKTPLIEASINGYVDIVVSLLKQMPMIDACDSHGMTALMHACKKSHSQIVKLLLVHGADSTIRDKRGRNAFRYCSFQWSGDVVHWMLGKKNTFLENDQSYWRTRQLFNAFDVETLKCVHFLIERGIPINSRNHEGQTALTWIASLSKHGSNGRMTHQYGVSCLTADMNDLLDLGASIELVDAKGQTAFSYTLEGDGQSLKVLLDRDLFTDGEGRLKAVHRKAVRKMLRDRSLTISLSALKVLLTDGLFEWAFCPERIMHHVGLDCLRLGYCPGSNKSTDGHLISPLIVAIMTENRWLIRMFLKNLFFLPDDLVALRTDPVLRAKITNVQLLEMVTKQNFDLESLSIISISKSISLSGLACKRTERVDALPIPNLLKTKLKFTDWLG